MRNERTIDITFELISDLQLDSERLTRFTARWCVISAWMGYVYHYLLTYKLNQLSQSYQGFLLFTCSEHQDKNNTDWDLKLPGKIFLYYIRGNYLVEFLCSLYFQPIVSGVKCSEILGRKFLRLHQVTAKIHNLDILVCEKSVVQFHLIRLMSWPGFYLFGIFLSPKN